MLKKLFLCAVMILSCTQCKASHCPDPTCSLVITLEPGETLMVKSSDGKLSTFFDYRETTINKKIDALRKWRNSAQLWRNWSAM